MIKKIIRYFLFLVFSILLGVVLFEAFCVLLLTYPPLLKVVPRKAADRIEFLYVNFTRKNIQTELGMVRYHPDLGYALNPGTWVFSNREFSHEFRINHAGMRDDEDSLIEPEVIVAGDSQAVGWGVAQEETFAQLIEKKSGLKVLNAAVPSYGTVREIMILDRVSTARLRYLIIQYCDNDYWENKTFFLNNNRLEIHSQAEWKAAHDQFRLKTRYYFGQYLVESWKGIVKKEKPSDSGQFSGKTGKDEGFLFINALMNAGRSDLSRARIIVLEIAPHNHNDREFVSNLAATLLVKPFPEAVRNMQIIDMSPHLSDGDYYLLDDHLNAKGHQRIAEILVQSLR